MIPVDQFGNLRASVRGGKSAVKQSQAAGSKARRLARGRKERRARVLLTREYGTSR